MNVIYSTDTSYSADVEIDDKGRVVFARDIKPGEPIRIPGHMLRRIRRK